MRLVFIIVCLYSVAASKDDNVRVTSGESKDNSTKEILSVSETSDPAKVGIVKQIRRLNEDGSYTIGYEADDGTFKIESRDVKGNVKGTFGYLDKHGEVKRVAYSSSSDSTPTPVPVTSSTTSSTPTPMMVVRVNKTVSTTRRPSGTVVYPTRSGINRAAVIQPMSRARRPSTKATTNSIETTTEKITKEESKSNILNLYKPKNEDEDIKKTKQASAKDDLETKQTTTDRSSKRDHTKPVYETVDDKPPDNKANTIRRQLVDTSSNPHMIHLQQSSGDDSTDVYGSHLSMGTVRPLFTTTTPRPRLVPIHSIIAAREKLQQRFPNLRGSEDHETNIEASTGRVFDHENTVTSNPVPTIHVPVQTNLDDRAYQQHPFYHRPAAVLFRTQEYLRDNPGSPIPIGNQRPYHNYDFQHAQSPQAKGSVESPAVQPYTQQYQNQPYDVPVTRIIQVPVDERGVPIPGLQARFINPYRTQTQQPAPPVAYQPRFIEPAFDDMNSIATPVSTRDLKRLLYILILRQNRLQALMDQLVGPGPAYQPISRQKLYERILNRYQDEDRYDFRYEQQDRQDMFYNQIDPRYEGQRYVPRRKLYTRNLYDTVSSSSNNVDELPEYLPADVREALLLKMLILAISPDYVPTPIPPTELTTAAPTRKQVRNIQILGEEGSLDEAKRNQRHK